MKTSPRLERPAPSPRLDNFGRNSSEPFPISTLIKSRFFSAPKLWPADERHVRRPGWTELFYDLVFAAAISQLSTPLEADYSLHGVVHYAFYWLWFFSPGSATQTSPHSLPSMTWSSALSLWRKY